MHVDECGGHVERREMSRGLMQLPTRLGLVVGTSLSFVA